MIEFNMDLGEIEAALSAIYSIGMAVTNTSFRRAFEDSGYLAGRNNFRAYVDAMATASPDQLHHVYEWNQVGTVDGRLFQIESEGTPGTGITIKNDWRRSEFEVPIPEWKEQVAAEEDFEISRHHVFRWKAPIMEEWQGTKIRTKDAQFLWFGDSKETQEFRRTKWESFADTRGNYAKLWNTFWSGGIVEARVVDPMMSETEKVVMSDGQKAIRRAAAAATSTARTTGRPGIHVTSQGKPAGSMSIEPDKQLIKRIQSKIKSRWRSFI